MIIRLDQTEKVKTLRERPGRRKYLIIMKGPECNPKYEKYFGCHFGLPYKSELSIRDLVTIYRAPFTLLILMPPEWGENIHPFWSQ